MLLLTNKLSVANQIHRISELELAEERYGKVRCLSPKRFGELYMLNLTTDQSFDELIDKLPQLHGG